MEIIPSTKGRFRKDGDVLRGVDPFQLERLTERSGAIMLKLDTALDTVNGIIGGKEVKETLSSVTELVAAGVKTVKRLDRIPEEEKRIIFFCLFSRFRCP